ncbi:MAG: glycosyltransferase [Thermoleophilaceae bacterium]|jgi:GT2 family glycosyltransferase
MTLLSVIVLNLRQPELLRACLRSLETALARVDGETELVVVDNGSGDGSGALVRAEFPRVLLTELPENRGFTGGVNVGLERSSGEFVALVNNDATLEPGTLLELLRVVETADDIGSVAAQMRFADRPETINSAGIGVDRLGIAYDRLLGSPVSHSEREPIEVFGASGGAVLWRRRVLDQIGALDDPYFIYLEDADAAWRARMHGWRALYAPDAVVWHHHSMTTRHISDFKYELVGRNRVRLLARNACLGQLLPYAPAMVAYDIAYIAYAMARDRTLAPLHGRLRGLREWRSARRSGAAGRRRVELEPRQGLGAALARRRAWGGPQTP